MGADNETIGSDWRGWGVRAGLVSVMAATGMVLAGHAAQATTMVTEPPGTQANGDGEELEHIVEGYAYHDGKEIPLYGNGTALDGEWWSTVGRKYDQRGRSATKVLVSGPRVAG